MECWCPNSISKSLSSTGGPGVGQQWKIRMNFEIPMWQKGENISCFPLLQDCLWQSSLWKKKKKRREIDDGLEFFQDTKQTGSLLVKVIKFIKKMFLRFSLTFQLSSVSNQDEKLFCLTIENHFLNRHTFFAKQLISAINHRTKTSST